MKKYKILSLPYLFWLIILIAIPLLLMIYIALSDMRSFASWGSISFEHFQKAFRPSYSKAFWTSIKLALIATVGTLLIGYPVAYIISNSKIRNKYLLLLIFILPMWTNLLLRVQIIKKILDAEGFMKNFFGFSFNIAGGEVAIVIAMIAIYLPFMIFPIYTVLEKMDKALIDAASDLGAHPVKSFIKVTLPLSLKGVMSGITMVFLPSAMGFLIPEIISGGKIMLIGNFIEESFKSSNPQYNLGSLLSLVIIVFVLGSLWLIGKIDAEGETLL